MRKQIAVLALLLAVLCLFSAGCPAEEGPRDGVYTPDRFEFSGGTGKVAITCPEVALKDGKATAKVVFSSTKYTEARLDDERYTPEYTGDGAVFTLPVPLNRTFSLYATTMAMSSPHEIEYRLYIGLGETGLPGLDRIGGMTLSYAEGFSVDYYEGGYALIDVKDGESYLVVPEGMEAPEGLDPSVNVLQKPIDRIYLAATSAMALFDSLNALDCIRLSGTRAEGWTVKNAVSAMEKGDILFAGKYSEPDYELLLREGCDLAAESMMILHAPKTRELLTLLGIPVFIDRSSSEPHPLGRLEWIRLYGLLTDREEEADNVFTAQAAFLESGTKEDGSGKTVGIFALKPDGTVTVRGSRDYLARCVELAGGRYVFETAEGQETSASVNLTMEAFYGAARDADVLILNASIETPPSGVDELLAGQPLLADMKAVREGEVYCTRRSLYQATDRIGDFIGDMKTLLSGGTEEMTFLYRLR